MIIKTIPRDQHFMVFLYVLNFIIGISYFNWNITSQELSNHIIHEHQDNNNIINTDNNNNNNINDDIQSPNNTNNENEENDDNPKEQVDNLKTNEATLWFHIAHYNISQFYL